MRAVAAILVALGLVLAWFALTLDPTLPLPPSAVVVTRVRLRAVVVTVVVTAAPTSTRMPLQVIPEATQAATVRKGDNR